MQQTTATLIAETNAFIISEFYRSEILAVSWFSAHVLTKLKSRCQPDAVSPVAVLISKICCQAHVVVIIQFLMAVCQSYFQFLEDACISCHVAPFQIQKHRNFAASNSLCIVRLQIHV